MKKAVGPVLEAGETATALVAAIREGNDGVEVRDRGAYLRVQVASRCVLRRDAVERLLGHPFKLPGDLELVMPSFAGRFTVGDDEAIWEAS